VTLARAASDSFAGIRPLPGFIAAQCVGAALAIAVVRWLLPRTASGDQDRR
jgi:hypothetical protein